MTVTAIEPSDPVMGQVNSSHWLTDNPTRPFLDKSISNVQIQLDVTAPSQHHALRYSPATAQINNINADRYPRWIGTSPDEVLYELPSSSSGRHDFSFVFNLDGSLSSTLSACKLSHAILPLHEAVSEVIRGISRTAKHELTRASC